MGPSSRAGPSSGGRRRERLALFLCGAAGKGRAAAGCPSLYQGVRSDPFAARGAAFVVVVAQRAALVLVALQG